MSFDDLDLTRLRRRTSVKWTKFGPDVLPLFVAEYAIGQLTEPGEPVAFFTPAYPSFFVAVETTRRAVAGVPGAASPLTS